MLIIISIFFLICLAVAVWMFFKISARSSAQLNTLTAQFNDRLKELAFSLQEAQRSETSRFDSALGVIGDVQNSLGRLEETNRQIFEVSKDISSLQNLLKAPKFRGEIGETLLGNLLSQVLPKEHYRLQHQFKSGETVDAIIYLGGHIVPVDAKFTLENFQGLLSAESDAEKNTYRKKFASDVKNRINEIAGKYILPDEGTFDFALMYIPAENVYYETIIKEDIQSYGLSKKVIAVSPNTFYAYLQVICLGLKGLQVERNAKEILSNLSRMQQDLIKFGEDFRLVGGHIQNALNKYQDAEKRLDKFQGKLAASSGTADALEDKA